MDQDYFNIFSFNNAFEGATVQSKSKTIKKTPKKSQESSTFQQEEALSHSPNPSSDDSSRVYDTFSSVEREKILENVKEEALKHLSLGDQANWHQEAAGFKPKVYKGILAKVIPKFRPNFDHSDSKKMTQMWRKVKTMLKNYQKPERRGAPVLLENELPEFKARLIPVIKSLQARSFKTLRERILPVINEIRVKNGRQPAQNVFGKHRWWDYLDAPENQDVKDLWNSLKRPQGRAAKDQVSILIESTEDSDDDDVEDECDEAFQAKRETESDLYGVFSSEEIAMYNDLAAQKGGNEHSYYKVVNMEGEIESHSYRVFSEKMAVYNHLTQETGNDDCYEMASLETCASSNELQEEFDGLYAFLNKNPIIKAPQEENWSLGPKLPRMRDEDAYKKMVFHRLSAIKF